MLPLAPEIRAFVRALLVVAVLVAGACESTTVPAPEHRLEMVAGGDQVGGAATSLDRPVTVAVVDEQGVPVVDAEVRWHVAQGGGSVSAALVRTDSAGEASVLWTLGREIGVQLLVVEAGGSSLSVRATSEFRITRVVAGFRHTCALTSTGDVYCWGSNTNGQLGDGTGVSSAVPVRVDDPVGFRSIAAGWFHTCAVSVLDEPFCWGDHSQGQLGSRPAGHYHAPVHVPELGTAFIAGGYLHTCTIDDAGALRCWGSDEAGQLAEAAGIVSAAAGEFHSCAIRDDAVALCWGLSSLGEVGGGIPRGTVVEAPTPVSDTLRFVSISASSRHTCAVSVGGSVFCWGRSSAGEIGRVPLDHVSAPFQVEGTEGFTRVTTGNLHTCGISGGSVYCWGRWLGNGTAGQSHVPVEVTGLSGVTDLSAGFDHTCAVTRGQVWCWGSNEHGQLGRPGPASSLVPVRVTFDR